MKLFQNYKSSIYLIISQIYEQSIIGQSISPRKNHYNTVFNAPITIEVKMVMPAVYQNQCVCPGACFSHGTYGDIAVQGSPNNSGGRCASRTTTQPTFSNSAASPRSVFRGSSESRNVPSEISLRRQCSNSTWMLQWKCNKE
jgi:hypothetical protein